MIKDCPISPAAKINYDASHDKSTKGVKIVAALASAIANKGGGENIDYLADTINDYFDDPKQDKEKEDDE